MANLTAFKNSVEFDMLSSELGSEIMHKYQLFNKIHESAFSQIFVICQRDSNEKYILKAINKNHADYFDLDAVSKVSHPNIVRIIDIKETEKFIYIIKEYIQGTSLDKFVIDKGPLSEKQIAEIGLVLCNILHYLHSIQPSPIIFRDLKPANLMISVDGTIKLIDLDSIRQYKSEAKNDTVYFGTEGYASPEQFGYGQTDNRTDIYTLGGTLYYLTTGRTPVIEKFMLKSIKNFRSDVSETLDSIIKKCMSFSPDHRYQTVVELQKEIELILNNGILKNIREKLKWKVAIPTIILITIVAGLVCIEYLPSLRPFMYQATNSTITPSPIPTPNLLSRTASYDGVVGASNPSIQLLTLGLDESSIKEAKLYSGGYNVDIQYTITGNTLQLKNNVYPANLLDIRKEYKIELTCNDGTQKSYTFTPQLQELSDANNHRVIFVPAMPEKGFNFPFYLTLPQQSDITNNKGKKNYILVESYNMGLASDNLSTHIEKGFQNALSNSVTIAEDLEIPRLVPVFIRPETDFNGKYIYTHALDRNTMYLNQFKKLESWSNPTFEPLDRIDLQLIQMVKYAQEYLRNNGWTLEDKIMLWGRGASGDFANRFTFLHPELVKASAYENYPTLAMGEYKTVSLPYPFGTSDYQDLTGKLFSVEAYNQVAKLGYFLNKHNDNPIIPFINSQEETDRILSVIPLQEFPDKFSLYNELYKDCSLNAQVHLYQDYSTILDDTRRFLDANRNSLTPVYLTPTDLNNTHSFTYSNGNVKEDGMLNIDLTSSKTTKEFSYDKTTIIEAFWSGQLPKKLDNEFVEFYKSQVQYNYIKNCFYVAIEEWDPQNDYHQMAERIRAVGGDLVLKADGFEDVNVRVDEGSMTAGNSKVYGVNVEDFDKIKSGVKYKLVDNSGHWIIKDDVIVHRPIK